MEKTPVRTAIVGCGKVGRLHAKALTELDRSRFVAVCDADLGRAEAFAQEFQVKPYSSVAQMCEEAEIGATMICTPHPLHQEPCLQAARAGSHVLIEKPMADSLAACDKMLEAAKKHGIEIGIVSQRRFLEPVQRMKAAIDAGKIGKPILGTFSMFSWRDEAYYASDPWRGRWDSEGGGVLVNQSPHQLDLLRWMMGPIEEISGYWANLNHPTIEVEDTAVAILRFASGGLGNIVTSVSQKPGIYTKVHIHGSNGASVGVETDSGASFVAGMSEITQPPYNDLWTIPGEEDLLSDFVQADRQLFQQIEPTSHYHARQIDDFLRAMQAQEKPAVSGEEGRAVVEMFAAIYESNRRGRPVRLPL